MNADDTVIQDQTSQVSGPDQTGAGRAEADQAFLFSEEGTSRKAITRDPIELPASEQGWRLVQTFTLGVQHIMPIDKEPEPVLRAIFADGFYVWDSAKLPEPSGTGQ